MKQKQQFIFTLLFIGLSIGIRAQDNDVIVTGEIINNLFKPVANVNIYIAGSAKGTISLEDGKFQIQVKMNDTLVFSTVMYKKLTMPVSEIYGKIQFIQLEEMVYELEAVDVFELRWKDFKYEVLNTDLKPIDKKILVIDGMPNPYTVLVPAKPSLIMNPATFLYEFLKKENIRKRKQKRWNKIYENSNLKVE
jgi:hypothetical protein